MAKFATAYVNFFENNVVSQVIEAKGKVDAMKKAILTNQKDIYTKEWLEGLGALSADQFKAEVLQGELGIDAVEIPE